MTASWQPVAEVPAGAVAVGGEVAHVLAPGRLLTVTDAGDVRDGAGPRVRSVSSAAAGDGWVALAGARDGDDAAVVRAVTGSGERERVLVEGPVTAWPVLAGDGRRCCVAWGEGDRVRALTWDPTTDDVEHLPDVAAVPVAPLEVDVGPAGLDVLVTGSRDRTLHRVGSGPVGAPLPEGAHLGAGLVLGTTGADGLVVLDTARGTTTTVPGPRVPDGVRTTHVRAFRGPRGAAVAWTALCPAEDGRAGSRTWVAAWSPDGPGAPTEVPVTSVVVVATGSRVLALQLGGGGAWLGPWPA